MNATETLVQAMSKLRYEALPEEVVERTKALCLDWMGSLIAGGRARPIQTLYAFSRQMGPETGPSEVWAGRSRSSPYFAALVNGAASHVVEQDDVHNGAVFHPATVVFPAVLAMAQATGATGKDFIAASVVGYEVGVRVGRFLGTSHYKVFHTTGTAGTVAAAAAVSHLLGADAAEMHHSVGSAGTQAAGLWEFLRDAADSKQLHTAKAASDGLLSAFLAHQGMTGAHDILEGEQGMARGMSTAPRPELLADGLFERWAVLETSLKFHASCRHTHPAADALREAIKRYRLVPDEIERVTARVHQAAIDVLELAKNAETMHQAKFSMPFVLALIALRGRASLSDFSDEALNHLDIREFMTRVEMVPDASVEVSYPEQWIGKVDVKTRDGRVLSVEVLVPKGDPENFLSQQELNEKVHRLARYHGQWPESEVDALIERVGRLEHESSLRHWVTR